MTSKLRLFKVVWTQKNGRMEFEADVRGKNREDAKKRFSKIYPEDLIVEVKE